jgi:hypothetical protein
MTLDPVEPYVYESYKESLMNYSKPNMTTAYINCQIIYTNLFFGKPFNLLFLEDLVLKFSS